MQTSRAANEKALALLKKLNVKQPNFSNLPKREPSCCSVRARLMHAQRTSWCGVSTVTSRGSNLSRCESNSHNAALRSNYWWANSITLRLPSKRSMPPLINDFKNGKWIKDWSMRRVTRLRGSHWPSRG